MIHNIHHGPDQLYLDEDLLSALHAHARTLKTSVSELVRNAVRERYVGKLDQRRKAMQAMVGIRADRVDVADSRK